MQRVLVERLLAEVPSLKVHRIIHDKLPNGAWFTFMVRPLPPLDQLQMVTADIDRGGGFHLWNDGTVAHSFDCTEQSHELENTALKKAVNNLKPQTFHFAVWEGDGSTLNGQPVVITLDPEITYFTYPDHPHISAGRFSRNFYLPDSLCYTDDPVALGNDPYTRTLEAIQQTCVWLFKHQVWLETRKNGKGNWIGPDVPAEEDKQIYYFRNPTGKCRCGSNLLYHQCCLTRDYMRANDPGLMRLFSDEGTKFNLSKYVTWWASQRYCPQQQTLSLLNKTLL